MNDKPNTQNPIPQTIYSFHENRNPIPRKHAGASNAKKRGADLQRETRTGKAGGVWFSVLPFNLDSI
jgi:hypothetical protein